MLVRMAERGMDMAETGGPAADAGSVRCRYRYHFRGGSPQGARVARHPNAYCQLELFQAGQASVDTGSGSHDLGPGDALVLPAGCDHAIHYRSACRYSSIKFTLEGRSPGPAPIWLPDSPLRRVLEAAIESCLVDDRVEPERHPRSTLEHCLAALLAWTLPPPEPASGDPLLQAVGSILRRRDGRALEVSDLARQVGLSPSRLSARLRAATGMGAKRLIDRSRAEAAARLLRYADHDIATIADLLEFPDPFTFSRFFHRLMGASPRTFRQRAGE
jgi:AraC-like DNA-binding protein